MRLSGITPRPIVAGTLSLALLVATGAVMAADAAPAAGKSEEAAVKKAHKQWTDSLLKKDAKAAEAVLMEDYTIVDPGGRPNTRQFIVDGLKGGLLKLDTVDVADMTVRVIGSTGIVTSVQTLKGTYDDSDVSGKFRVTDVLVKQDGKWMLAAGHMTKCEE
jgi:ketosteroid isomerase-like protein